MFLYKIININKNKVIVAGRWGGDFFCNCKYFYLYLKNKGLSDIYWLTDNKKDDKLLKAENIHVLK